MTAKKPSKSKKTPKKASKKTPARRETSAFVPKPSEGTPDFMSDDLKALLAQMRDNLAEEFGMPPQKPRVKRFAKKPKPDENGEEKKCFICGATSHLVRTPCCGKWICDDESDYVLFSYARNSCYRNHQRYTLCGAHFVEGHGGDWKTCPECRGLAEPEMVAWFGPNEYNWEKMPDPPAFKPTLCSKCGKRIVLPEGGYSVGRDGYVCDACDGW